MPGLFDPLALGPLNLHHRVVLAPLTRMRAFERSTPTPLMAEYYAQRASPGGLLIAEATVVAPDGFPHIDVPAVYTAQHIEGWQAVTQAVHARGGHIYLQLWHGGRASHPDLIAGATPVGPSALQPADGGATLHHKGRTPFPMPRALEVSEIEALIEAYAQATRNAKEAGFDGVEVHCANGYLPDQFLQDGANQRTDRYGGSVENRARFALEVVEACAAVIGMDRVGARISPQNTFNGMSDSDPATTFEHFAEAMSARGLGYLHVIEPRVRGNTDLEEGAPVVAARQLRSAFKGVLMAAGGFTRESGMALVEEGGADLIAYGRLFIANPDLPARFKADLALNPYDRATFYGGDHRGYTDYPVATAPTA
ncbi:MAG: alkene reductase [Pseudomonadota bacterium]